MAALSARDYERMLDLVMCAMVDIDEGRSAWQRVCVELGGSVDAALAGMFDIGWPEGVARRRMVWPAWVDEVAMTNGDSAAHPLVRHFGLRRAWRTRTLRDVPDDCGWLTAPRYAAAREQLGDVTEHVGVPLSVVRGGFRFVALGRPDTNFTDHEQAYLSRVQPVLARLDGHLETVVRWRGANGTGSAPSALEEHRITPRELTVLALFADGLTIPAIGRRLGISPRTVTKHQENLQRKLRTRDRLTTVLRAQRLGIV
ncbi:LuxR C-terminal-related transcriptional regulator [Dactylosporangium sp. NPDC049140]|uniref:response regulator transcription factor n=1 Tax=Dactylosporangium sp. NPDC049140 TaxID=3155647 RepID=UPI00340D1332